jgi:hypothetical protein
MRITEANPINIRQLWSSCASRIATSPYLDDITAAVVGELYEQFADSLVMVRAFITVPFEYLPERQREFARELARSVQLEALLNSNTPVHSLLATRGCIDDWNDPRKSRGHVAIPLLSEAFVDSIPMMSRLLKELGLSLTWVHDPGAVLLRQTIGAEVGYFHVEDAPSATDELGRKIIAAQEFVSNYGVKSVFAVGGVVFGGAVLVLIFFSRDRVEPRIVRTFMPLTNFLKAAMISQCSLSKAFRPDGREEEADPSSSTSRNE